MPVEPGQDLLHYRVIEKIGEGGMGVVWKALDTTLDREVAIKVLPASVTADNARIARFEREAKLLASLNHPNVATVYGVHEADGKRFLAMELVPGEDLAQRLLRARMEVGQAVRIAVRIIEGLEAAHAQGVVHRDLKPANVRVTPDGAVKILDFGLAKGSPGGETEQDRAMSPTITSAGSMPGALLGTAAYMSPEQARGHEADSRSDVWAFGCVLWECLTGQTLFARGTVSDTIAAVLRDEPDWQRLPQDTPPNVRRLLKRCLARDPSARWHHVSDARIELAETEAEAPSVPRTPRGYRIAVAALALTLLGVLAMRFLSSGPSSRFGSPATFENPLAGARITRVTDFPGSEHGAAISPDGRFVAFVSDRDGPFDVFVTQLGTNEFRNLTHDEEINYVTEIRRVGFNADGTEIWLGGGLGQQLRSHALLGGPKRNLIGEHAVNVDWSPGGRRMVYHDRTPGDPMFVAGPDGSEAVKILEPASGVHQHFPVWSTDGEWIFFSRGRPATAEMDLWRVRPDGTNAERLTEGLLFVTFPTPIDERTVLFTARDRDGAGPWIWACDTETGTARRISIGIERYNSIAASADRRRLVATVLDPRPKLWSVPVLDRVAVDSDALPFDETADLRALAPRFGSSSMYFLSSLGDGDGLYRLQGGLISEIWRGAEKALLEPAAVSPDGAWVALLLREDSGWYVNLVSADGAQRRTVTERVDARGASAWSPDGKWIVTGGSLDGADGLFKIPVDGGEPQRLVEGEALNPEWSPDGKLIVYSGKQVAAISPLRAIDADGNPVALPDIQVWRGGERYRFTPDGTALIIMQGKNPAQDFERLDLETMERRVLTRFESSARMRTFDVTPDGKSIVFDRFHDAADIVLIELAR